MRPSPQRWIRPLQHFFYACFIVLWFKDNFAPFRELRISFWLPLLPLLGLSGVRFGMSLREKSRQRSRRQPRSPREIVGLGVLLVAAILFRLPFLAHPAGTMTSDDAIPALMGKHIAEGKVPPVCFYGQLYMGSLSSHFYALGFKIFGYSLLVLKGVTLIFFLAFMTVQFYLLKEVFSFCFALAVTFFYSLPLPQLIIASLDNTSAYPLVLLLSATLLYLGHRIVSRQEEKLAPVLGFLAGLAFWTHPITAAFILTCLLFLFFGAGRRLKLRSWFLLVYGAFLGFLPQLLVELTNRFSLVSFLAARGGTPAPGKFQDSIPFLASLLAESGHPLRYLFLSLVLIGFLFLLGRTLRAKVFLPETMFSLLFFIFLSLYLLSPFSGRAVVRYFYPLYVCLPVLMLAAFLVLRSKWQNFLLPSLVVGLFLGFNLRASLNQVERTAGRDSRIRRVQEAMEKTGCRYWLADYWTAYLFTAVSGERLIVDSYSVNRYPAYSLAYWNEARTDAYIFLFREDRLERAYWENFSRWLEKFGLKHKERAVGVCRLYYDLETRFPPRALLLAPPSLPPPLEIEAREFEDGFLRLFFRSQGSLQEDEFRLIASIPGFSRIERTFAAAEDKISITLPYPEQNSFRLRYHLDYRGVAIPQSERELEIILPDDAVFKRDLPVVFLQGIGPQVEYQGQKCAILTKESTLEFNPPPGSHSRLRLLFYSPFGFLSWRWYGKYAQTVRVEANGQNLGEIKLKDGENILDLAFPAQLLRDRGNIIRLAFRYHLWYFSYPFWQVAAFLDRVEVD
ncbi:MAG: glycosyltransferase family 39 protein [Candidatus Aminicenantales bacterium]